MAKLWAHVTDPPPAPSLKRPDLPAGLRRGGRARDRQGPERSATPRPPSSPPRSTRRSAGQRSGLAPDGLQVTRAAAAPVLQAPPPPPPAPASGEAEHDLFIAEPAPGPSAPRAGRLGVSASGAGQRRHAGLGASAAVADERRDAGRGAPSPPAPSAGPPVARPPPGRPQPRSSTKRRWPIVAALALLAGGARRGRGPGRRLVRRRRRQTGRRRRARCRPRSARCRPTRSTGSATRPCELKGNVATVTLKTNGLLDGQPHAMHIHAGEKGACPTVGGRAGSTTATSRSARSTARRSTATRASP